MARHRRNSESARRNPIGMPSPKGVKAVRIGEGKLVHCLAKGKERILCRSGIYRTKKPQQLYASRANFITCYRCSKLMSLNLEAGRSADDPGQSR